MLTSCFDGMWREDVDWQWLIAPFEWYGNFMKKRSSGVDLSVLMVVSQAIRIFPRAHEQGNGGGVCGGRMLICSGS